MEPGSAYGKAGSPMREPRLSDRTVKALRVSAICGGLGLAAIALLADPLGLSGPGLGRGQTMTAVAGAILALAGLIDKPFRAYRALAVLLLNAVLLFAFLELAATVSFRVASRELQSHSGDEHDTLLQERQVVYAPFVGWREQEHRTELMNVGPDQRRVTTGASSDPEAYEVFCFGGSTMIGWGVPDSLTIPSILQKDLGVRLNVPVRVVNFGQQAYVNTQELIELMLQLRAGRRPNLVIFYDGINDAFAAYQSGIAGVHENLPDISRRFVVPGEREAGQPVWKVLAERSNLLGLLRQLLAREPGREAETPVVQYSTMGVDADSLASDVAGVYEGNCGIVLSLSEQYGYRAAFYWQPVLGVGGGEDPGRLRKRLADGVRS
jgi:hypothetical protein